MFEVEDREAMFGGRLGWSGSSQARLEGVRSRLVARITARGEEIICSNPECGVKGVKGGTSAPDDGVKMSECGQCRRASYCSRACQVAHWPAHKSYCKEAREEMKAKEVSDAQTLLRALAALDVSPGESSSNDAISKSPAGATCNAGSAADDSANSGTSDAEEDEEQDRGVADGAETSAPAATACSDNTQGEARLSGAAGAQTVWQSQVD